MNGGMSWTNGMSDPKPRHGTWRNMTGNTLAHGEHHPVIADDSTSKDTI